MQEAVTFKSWILDKILHGSRYSFWNYRLWNKLDGQLGAGIIHHTRDRFAKDKMY